MIEKSELFAAFNGITDLIVILDNDFTIEFANSAFCDFFDVDNPAEIIGRKCYEITQNESKRCNECPTQKTLESGNVKTMEKEIRGEILKYWIYPVFDNKKSIKNIVSCARIITEQKRIEQELIRAEKLKGIGILAAGAAHEINNPLCSILGYSELIKESISKTDSIYEFVNDIIESVKQAKKITSGLLEYSKQNVNTLDYCNIDNVVNKAITLVKYQTKDKQISISFKDEQNLPKVQIDMLKTVHAFLNIILNGIEASPRNGTIAIAAQRNGEDYISVTFTDRGCGISQENLSSIFNPFFTTKETGKNTGLGLSIAHSIIEQQNGEIMVESKLGKGSTFEVLFPIMAEIGV